MTQSEIYLITAYGAALAGRKAPTPTADIDWSALLDMAVAHGAASSLYYSVTDVEGVPEDFVRKLADVHEKAVYKDLCREEEAKSIFRSFEQAEIAYLPLKGAVLRMYYPKTDMRLMGDTDVIINTRDRRAARSIMKDNGYTFTDSQSNHDVYTKPDGQTFELHFKPEDDSSFHRKLLSRAVAKEGSSRLSLTVDDFYVYLITHLARHMQLGGAGLRMFADIKVFCARHAADFNKEYIERTLESLGLIRFEVGVKSLVAVLFYGQAMDALTKNMLDYVLDGGVFGNAENVYANKRGDKSKIGYFFSSVFPSYSSMKERYPFLKYLPFMLPFMWIFRWFALLFKGKQPAARYRKAAQADSRRIENNKLLFKTLGLRYGKGGMSGGDIALCIILIAVLLASIIILGKPLLTETEYGREELSLDISSEDTEETTEATTEDTSDDGSFEPMPESYYGEITFKNGLYKGYLISGVPNGSGILTFSNGESYIGGFSDGEFNGRGVYNYQDGSSYDGMWFEGEINGQGALHFADGSYIFADFIEGETTGICSYEYPNGDFYEGPLVDWKRHGEGKFRWVNGDTYEGSFVNGERQGYGVYTYCGGEVSYEGYWVENVQNGYGNYKTEDGVFSGVYVQGVLEGKGTARFSNGDKYEGIFVHGVMSDENGTYTFRDGSKYKGSFKSNSFEGTGTLTFRDGSWVKGSFEKGLLQGKATYYDKDTGKKKTVTYKDGKPQD